MDVSRQSIDGGKELNDPCFYRPMRPKKAGRLYFLMSGEVKIQISEKALRHRSVMTCALSRHGKTDHERNRKAPRLIEVLTILLLAACLSGCRSGNTEATKSTKTREVTDDLGRSVAIPEKVTRVVSLAPSITESIFAIGAGDRLVGDTTYCNYPEEARSVQKVGDTINPNLETIVALKPDVVFVTTASQIEAFKNTLEQNGIAVYVMNPTSLFDVFKNLKQLGELFGTTDKADKLVEELRQRATAVEWVTKGQEPTRVFVQISKEPLFTIGKQSFITGFLEIAFAHSVTADIETAYPKLSKETAVTLNPDAIILSASEDNREPNEVFRDSPAVRNGRVFSIDADLLSRPGPRLVDALEQIARDLHPEKYPDN